MRVSLSNTGALLLSIWLSFTPAVAEDARESAESSSTAPYSLLPMPELESLVASIALYPDPLLGILLPASTFPLQVVQAARFARENEGVTEPPIDAEWDSSVIALLNYPEVLFMMDEYLDWMSQLGDAVYFQQADVMEAIQAVRQKAESAGHLESNDKQVVIQEREVIQIVPADPEVVYVPYYDPDVIFVERVPTAYPVISFGIGYYCGPWLAFSCDWYSHGIAINHFYYGGHWHRYWGYDYWRPHHRPHHRHHGHHGDRDGDHWDGRRPGEGHGPGEGPHPEAGKIPPPSAGAGHPGKIPSNVINQKVPGGESLPRAGAKPLWRQGYQGSSKPENRSLQKVPYYPQYDPKQSRTTLKIPNENSQSPSSQGGPGSGSYKPAWRAPKTPSASNPIYGGSGGGSYKPIWNAPKTPTNNRIYGGYGGGSYKPTWNAPKIPSGGGNPSYGGFGGGMKVPSANQKVPSAPMGGGGGKGFSGGKGGGKR